MQKAAKPETTFQDHVSAFLKVKPLDFFQLFLWQQKLDVFE